VIVPPRFNAGEEWFVARFSAANEQVQWTCENNERRSGARPSATRGRDAAS